MATPLTADGFLVALHAEGVRVAEYGSWRTHTRTSSGRPWGPVHGVVIHHTVSSGTSSSVELCAEGYAGLPGPLCHGVIAKDGIVHLVGSGRTNHAGGGDPVVLQHVIDEDYSDRPPAPTKGNADGVDGNARFYGFECINLGDGKDPWPAAQLDAIERVSAALCRAHGWSAKSVIGHLEWSDDKSDPRGFTMPDMRARVARRLSGQSTPPKPAPRYTEDAVITYLPPIPANTDVDIPVEPAGTLADPQGGARNGPLWLCLAAQGADGQVVTTYHQEGGSWGAPAKAVSVTVAGSKHVMSLPAGEGVDKVRIRSTVPLVGYVTGRQVA
ncbi:N-acetylmuramoyl-L-alanine amidase [Streptomyces sp. NPDC053079]|uniref:N-acetylmuramoyl-L-alanine amidase n=1 Tax=Streptomyces sp. NPDC053079 TaxID=3365697 RepID=UPI0037CEB7B3